MDNMNDIKIWTPEACEPFKTVFRPAVFVPDKPKERLDGDTFWLRVDAGFYINGPIIKVRLIGDNFLINHRIGVDTWELKKATREKGELAKARCRELLTTHELRTFTAGKGGFGRWLTIVLLKQEDGWKSLGDILIKEGHGLEWWRNRKKGAKRPDNPPTPILETWSWETNSYL
jgi:endonuclease YncB( thermonuclease family)